MIIASSQISAESSRWLADSPIPVIIINAEPGELPVTVITSDNVGGSRMAVEHLVSLGHRRIAYVSGHETFSAALPRMAGFRAGCLAAGIDPDEMPVYQGDGQVDGGERAAGQLLVNREGVTGVSCYNDLTAIGVLRAFRAAGLRVPQDISVIGCDDIAAASWVAPALTTVAQQKAEMGRLAVERLVALLDEPDAPPEVIHLPMVLRVRESTGPASAEIARRSPGPGQRETKR
jgi:DNA-binding LacI/PurR family transcriptional regulator